MQARLGPEISRLATPMLRLLALVGGASAANGPAASSSGTFFAQSQDAAGPPLGFLAVSVAASAALASSAALRALASFARGGVLGVRREAARLPASGDLGAN